MILRRALSTFIAALALFSAPALALDPSRALTQYGRTAWQIEDGLPGNRIDAVLQTRDGYLWLATQEGLVRFDGVRFTVFDKQNTPELKANTLNALYEDPSGALWIGSYGGGLTRLQNGKFTHYGPEQGLSDSDITGIAELPDGQIIVSTYSGVLDRWDGQQFQKMDLPGIPPLQNISVLYSDSRRRLWIGSRAGLICLEGNNKVRFIETGKQLPAGGILSLRTDSDGILWMGILGSGLWRLINDTLEPVSEWNGGTTLDIFEDKEGALWFGTDGAGLYRLLNGKFEQLNRSSGLTSDIVQAVVADAEGSLWLGTRGGGLGVLRDQKLLAFTPAEGLSHDNVRSLFEDTDGTIWAGTYGGGLSSLQKGKFTALSKATGLSSDLVSCVIRDKEGTLWIGTKSEGLNQLRNGKLKVYSTADGLPAKQIFSLYADPAGGMWIGTSSGLAFLKNDSFTVYTTANGLSSNLIFSLIRDRAGDLWVGTFKGLNRFRNNKFEAFNHSHGLSSEIILSLHEDSKGTLWIGTVGGGLNSYSNGRFSHYTSAEGLHDDNVYSVLEDAQGRLWLSGNKGISSVRKSDLDAFSRSEIRTIPVDVYGNADGMKSRECNGGTQPSAWKTRDGRLLFPTIRGFIVIDPARIHVNKRVPPVFVERVLLDGKTANLQPGGALPPGSGRLEFQFTGLSFLAPERMQFRYQLENFDRDWIDAGRSRSAIYTNLPPGAYTFRVIAANNDGLWNESGASFAFAQKPHYYQTIWFYALLFAAVVAAGVGVHRLRLRSLESRQEHLAALVEERTLDLSAARQRLAEANESLEKRVKEGIDALREAERMAAYGSMVAGVAHEVRQPVFALQAASYVLQERLKENTGVHKQLRTLERETRRMAALMDDLLEFAKPPALVRTATNPRAILQEAVEIFSATGDPDGPEVIIDASDSLPVVQMDHARMLQVFANLMNNARKHAGKVTQLRLSAKADANQLQFLVHDNGEGIPEEHRDHIFEPFYSGGKGTGLGLPIVQRIVTDHGGIISVDSGPERGTTFVISLPLQWTGHV